MDIQVLASGSKGNAYRISDGQTPLLIECGIPWKKIQQKLHFRTSEIEACLVTHEHQDHSKAVKDVMNAGIDVYMSEGTKDALGATGHRVNVIKAEEQLNIGSWTILPFKTQHDAVEPLGFLMQSRNGDKLLFATDTYYLEHRFKNLNYIMVECNYSYDILQENIVAELVDVGMKNRLLQSHFSLENVKGFLKANDLQHVREIWLLHLSDRNSDAPRFKREIQALTGKPVYIAEGN